MTRDINVSSKMYFLAFGVRFPCQRRNLTVNEDIILCFYNGYAVYLQEGMIVTPRKWTVISKGLGDVTQSLPLPSDAGEGLFKHKSIA